MTRAMMQRRCRADADAQLHQHEPLLEVDDHLGVDPPGAGSVMPIRL